jgi:hypothetical protein
VQVPQRVFKGAVLERLGQLAGGDECDDRQRDGPVQQAQQGIENAVRVSGWMRHDSLL